MIRSEKLKKPCLARTGQCNLILIWTQRESGRLNKGERTLLLIVGSPLINTFTARFVTNQYISHINNTSNQNPSHAKPAYVHSLKVSPYKILIKACYSILQTVIRNQV